MLGAGGTCGTARTGIREENGVFCVNPLSRVSPSSYNTPELEEWESRVPGCLPAKGANGELEVLPFSIGHSVPGGSNRAGLPLEITLSAASSLREPGPGGRVCETFSGHFP
jgi:hypothetical protein